MILHLFTSNEIQIPGRHNQVSFCNLHKTSKNLLLVFLPREAMQA